MKAIPIKGIILGTLISLLLGFVAYVVAAIAGIYLNGLQRTRTNSDEAVEVINAFLNSQEVYIFSFPVTFLLMGIAGYFGAKKSIAFPYLAIVLISVLVCISMNLGLTAVVTIYKNYIPVVLGCFIGGHIWVRKQNLTRRSRRDKLLLSLPLS